MTVRIGICAHRGVVERALAAAIELTDWDEEPVLVGAALPGQDRAAGQDWRLDGYFAVRPGADDLARLDRLFAPGEILGRDEEELDEGTDWVRLSQSGLEPIQCGRFHIRTPEMPERPIAHGERVLTIPAGTAFGTGHHPTTLGCISMLQSMRATGLQARRILDIGTGTGILAFASQALWPGAEITATDIDPAAIDAVLRNAERNGVPLGDRRGAVLPLLADGTDHPLIAARGPHDLLIANILAGPLVALAPAIAALMAPGGSVLLAGLLESQEAAVRRACARHGLRLARRAIPDGWSILWLRARRTARAGGGRDGAARRAPGNSEW